MIRYLLLILLTTTMYAQENLYNVNPGVGNGIRFWNHDNYKIHMGNTSEYKYGPVTDFSIKMNMSDNILTRGWTWGTNGAVPVAALNVKGDFQIAGTFKSNLGVFEAMDTQAATNATDWKDWGKYSLVLSAGKVLETKPNGQEIRKFQFFDHPATSGGLPAGTSLNLRNDNNEIFLAASSFNLESRFHVADPEGAEIIKAGNFSANSSNNSSNESVNWVHLPKANSRLAIGSWAMYKPEHEFTVRGSGWFEHEIITNSKIGVGVQAQDIPSDYKLAVDGKIIGEEVKVQLSGQWPDYVFEKEYALPSIYDVEAYIKEKGHLKNIPSAKEIEKAGGVTLGQMNIKLLEKIEELTLYIIAQQKENDMQKRQLEQSEEKYLNVEERLKRLEILVKNSED
jgi:hypothetical protein